jgi:hypothetical protein
MKRRYGDQKTSIPKGLAIPTNAIPLSPLVSLHPFPVKD